MNIRWLRSFYGVLLVLLLVTSATLAGTTGKLVGTVRDAETGEPIVGANIVLVGTTRGAATDLDGDYMILNLSPGRYTIRASVLGYNTLSVEDAILSVDRTTVQDFDLSQAVLQAAEAVTVTAKAPVVKRDLTSSEAVVDIEQLQMTPVDNIGDAVSLQAGVVNGHFRGGRSSEVSYMIDGVVVSDPYSEADPLGRTTSNQVELAGVQEIQVISGTFNAEYGQAMSGIINVVTKEGDDIDYHGSVQVGLGDYVSGRSLSLGEYYPAPDKTTYSDDLNLLDLQDYQFSLSGPVPMTSGRTSFFISSRYLYDKGRLYGQRIFMPGDSSNFSSTNPSNWYIEHTGDGEVVTLDPFEKVSGQLKLTQRFTPTLKLSYTLMADNMEYQNLDGTTDGSNEDNRLFKYDPDGNYTRYQDSQNHILQLNHALNNKTFYNLSLSFTKSEEKYYVYENWDQYANPDRLTDAQNYAYYTGGQGMWHHYRETDKVGLKFDITSQVDKKHLVKFGTDVSQYRLQLTEYQLIWDDDINGVALNPLGSWNHYQYPDREATSPLGGFPFSGPGYRPTQFATYLQDKMEYEFMVVNFGLRFDYFHSDGIVPTDTQDPANDSYSYYDSETGETIYGLDPLNPIADPTSTDPATRYNYWSYKYRDAEPVTQVSPRIGVAFPISQTGVVHFSYGHFFQIPSFQYLYYNPQFTVTGGEKMHIVGNSELKPEQTVMYEIGLQQALTPVVALSVTGYYKDIRNLLGTEILSTYAEVQYARYVNKDYANVRGVTVAVDKQLENYFGMSVDYTFQIAEGNSSDPLQVYNYSQSDPPQEVEKKVRPLDWDQSHTLNASVTFGDPSDWSIGLIGRLGSGLPYTSNPYLGVEGELNDSRKPFTLNFDLKAYKVLTISGLSGTVTLYVYNVFDLKNENDVWADTGRATYTLEQLQVATVRGFNSMDDYYNRPEWYSSPRQVKITYSISF